MCRYTRISILSLLFLGQVSMVNSLLDNDSLLPGKSRRRRGVTVRLHLVRHGETEANRANYVLGQRESPLTEKGISQALALGSSIGLYPFWRAYSSDYERTRTTAAMILGGGEKADVKPDGERRTAFSTSPSEDELNGATAVATASVSEVEVLPSGEPLAVDTSAVNPDKRLRERAKGVREGRPKSLSFGEALDLYRAEHGEDEELPLLESDDDVWDRVKSWIVDVVRDASNEEIESAEESSAENDQKLPVDSAGREYERNTLLEEEAGKDRGASVDPRSDSYYRRHNIYDVLVVSHSATIRTAVNRLVGEQLPSSIVRGSGGKDGTTAGQLIVPNTSRTIIDIIAEGADDSLDEDGESRNGNGDNDESVNTPRWSAKLLELTNTDHIQKS